MIFVLLVVLTPISHEFSFRPQPENTKYKLLQMHFHWRGSEHYLNAHRYAGELHLVHQNVEDSSKFAVLGFLIKAIKRFSILTVFLKYVIINHFFNPASKRE